MTRAPSKGQKGPRRSLHFVPGGNDRMFEKALTLSADSLILDLEDSVTPVSYTHLTLPTKRIV